LYKTLKEIFPPGIEILEEYQLPEIFVQQTGFLMTFDIYVPSMHIIIEYHGYQHYYDHYVFGEVKSHKERDKKRREACEYHKITYLEVPYWWQCDMESLIAMICLVRPDIVLHAPHVIPFHYNTNATRKNILTRPDS